MSTTDVLCGLGAVAVATVLWLRWRSAVVTVQGQSMYPTYSDGDRLLVWRPLSAVRVGAVVVFVPPDGPWSYDVPWLVKRVVAVDGDPVPADMRTAVTGSVVGERLLVVRGDAARSLDSRQFGPVGRDRVRGIVLRRLALPPTRRAVEG